MPFAIIIINTTFASMRKKRDIFFNIILLLIVSFFLGIDAHANSETQRYYVEYASSNNNFENKLNHHIDIIRRRPDGTISYNVTFGTI